MEVGAPIPSVFCEQIRGGKQQIDLLAASRSMSFIALFTLSWCTIRQTRMAFFFWSTPCRSCQSTRVPPCDIVSRVSKIGVSHDFDIVVSLFASMYVRSPCASLISRLANRRWYLGSASEFIHCFTYLLTSMLYSGSTRARTSTAFAALAARALRAAS